VKESFFVEKALNNNVLIASHSQYKEVVLIGKGIAFGKKQGDEISTEAVEKMFLLQDAAEQEQYKQILAHVDETFIEVMNDIMTHIGKSVQAPLNEHIHVALTDHIAFALKRIQQGIQISNPFLIETKTLYAKEYAIAEDVIDIIHQKLGVQLPEGEVAFIALHIHSAITRKNLSEVNQHSQLIHQIIRVIEDSLKIEIDRESIYYMRLIRHLHFAIDRVKKGEKVEESVRLADILRNEYPMHYSLAWKVIKVMQQSLKVPVYDAEAVYLTMHLQRLTAKEESE